MQNSSGGDPHGWNSLNSYVNSHDGNMLSWEHFIPNADSLVLKDDKGDIKIQGRLQCLFGLYIDVNKTLEMNAAGQVRTAEYSYHAAIVAGDIDRPIFRYDNSHAYTREGHADEHHKHVYDVESGDELRPPQWVGYENWPTLSQVIEELRNWWVDTGERMFPENQTLV